MVRHIAGTKFTLIVRLAPLLVVFSRSLITAPAAVCTYQRLYRLPTCQLPVIDCMPVRCVKVATRRGLIGGIQYRIEQMRV